MSLLRAIYITILCIHNTPSNADHALSVGSGLFNYNMSYAVATDSSSDTNNLFLQWDYHTIAPANIFIIYNRAKKGDILTFQSMNVGIKSYWNSAPVQIETLRNRQNIRYNYKLSYYFTGSAGLGVVRTPFGVSNISSEFFSGCTSLGANYAFYKSYFIDGQAGFCLHFTLPSLNVLGTSGTSLSTILSVGYRI